MAGYGEDPGRSTTRIWEDFLELLTVRLQETLGFSDLMEWYALPMGTVHIWHIWGLARRLFQGGSG